jgi:hypothetical protein
MNDFPEQKNLETQKIELLLFLRGQFNILNISETPSPARDLFIERAARRRGFTEAQITELIPEINATLKAFQDLEQSQDTAPEPGNP